MHKQGMPLIEDTDAEICLGCFLPWLAEGLGHAGEIEEGLKVLRRAQATATDHFYDAERLRIEGQLRTNIDRDEARRCFRAAIDASQKASMKSLELRAALALHDFQLSQDEKVDIGGLFGHLDPGSRVRSRTRKFAVPESCCRISHRNAMLVIYGSATSLHGSSAEWYDNVPLHASFDQARVAHDRG